MSNYYVSPPPLSPLGAVIPSGTPHAVSVSLPLWKDNVDYEEGHERIKKSMNSGYPRFYIHHQIDQLAQLVCKKFGTSTESCLLLPSLNTAKACQDFLQSQSKPVSSHLIHYPIRSLISSPSPSTSTSTSTSTNPSTNRIINIHACFFQTKDFSIAKQFWQHTGDGISSRVAERCLILLGELDQDGNPNSISIPMSNRNSSSNPSPIHSTSISHSITPPPPPSTLPELILSNKSTSARYGAKNPHFHSTKPITTNIINPVESIISIPSSKSRYSTQIRKSSIPSDSLFSNGNGSGSDPSTPLSASIEFDNSVAQAPNGTELQEEDVLTRYVEERYGRNLDLSLAPLAKLAMRRRIAGVIGTSNDSSKFNQSQGYSSDLINDSEGGGGIVDVSRGVEGLDEKDVWLYPCGMSAIWHAHQLALATRIEEGGKVGKSVCFGFPYTDTLKILEKWGPGCEFFGNGLLTDIPALRTLLSTASPPILAIFCEFPSNPLLRTPPLRELKKLADEFGAMIIIDETIAGFVNVEVLPLADIVVSSLTKVFSGDSNVMGGSLVINPNSKHYTALQLVQSTVFEDVYFDEDAIYMERNSRDFQQRIARENFNAETLCTLLQSYRVPGPVALGMKELDPTTISSLKTTTPIIKEIYYPKYMTPEHYLDCIRPTTSTSTPGFGGLFSLTFTSILASSTFFDHLSCYKGPSLGTNFTLACPYTILAHYEETAWALGWGVEKGLVRISVGLEDPEILRGWFLGALEIAERVCEEDRIQRREGGEN